MQPLTTLQEALTVASIRNECRHMMTNDQNEIDPAKQKEWFESFYKKQNPFRYKIWILKKQDLDINPIIGYFAAKETDDGIYITEGISETWRGQGMGTFMLQTVFSKNLIQHKSIYADIFNHNDASIRLHQKFGFKIHSNIAKNITRFILKQILC